MKATQRRLTSKLLVLLLLPTTICIGGYGALSAAHRRAELRAEADRELSDEVAVLKVMLPAVAATASQTQLEATVNELTQRRRLHGVALYDPSCHPIARSQDLDKVAAEVDRIACETLAGKKGRHGIERFSHFSALLRAEPLNASSVGLVVVTYDLAEIEAMISSGTGELVLAGLVLLMAMGGAALVFARVLARPLGNLIDGAERVARGDLSARVESAKRLELKRVTEAFNHMMESLAAARRREDESETHRREFERRSRHTQALSVVGQVAASLAHDLSSPLSTILGWLRTIGSDATLAAKARAEAVSMADQCERITRIIRRMLEVARPALPPRVAVNLVEVAREVLEFLAPEFRQRHIRASIEAGAGEEAFEIVAERDVMVQLLLNLCVNATVAQPDGGVIVVALRQAPAGEVALEVRDGGPGVPEEIRAQIFEPFFSARDHQTTGLGLWIVAGIVREQGGSVSVDVAPEGGARFLVLLPSTTELRINDPVTLAPVKNDPMPMP